METGNVLFYLIGGVLMYLLGMSGMPMGLPYLIVATPVLLGLVQRPFLFKVMAGWLLFLTMLPKLETEDDVITALVCMCAGILSIHIFQVYKEDQKAL